MRRLLATLLLAAVWCLTPSVAAASPSALVVQSVETSAYPAVTVRVMVPSSLSRAGTAPAFTVKENGVELAGVNARPVAIDRAPLSIVLVMDTSGSMRGEPLAAAKQAAATFIGALAAEDRVAVVGFNTRPDVLSRFTADRASSLAAVGQLQASGETAMYDALIAADTLAFTAPSTQRIVVLLSDGGDTQSSSSLDTTLRFLKQGAVPVFALGLASPEAAPAVLARIASETRGRSLGVEQAGDLGRVYADVARQIQNRYDVAFTSADPATKDLELAISGRSGPNSAAADLVIANPAFAAPRVSQLAEAARSGAGAAAPMTVGILGIFAVAGLVFGAVMLFALFVFRSLARKPSAMEQLSYYEQSASADDSNPGGLRARLMSVVGQVAERRGFTGELQVRLEAAGLPLRPVEYITVHVVFVVAAGFVTEVFTGSLGFSLAVILVSAFAPLLLLDLLATRRKKAFAAQLPDVLGLIAGSLRAGYGLMQAVDHIVREAPAPASVEFQRVQTEARLGLRVEDALEKMARRMGSPDFEWAVSAITIQREVGGNLAEVLDIVGRTIRERDALRRTIDGLTAEGRLSAVILVILPFVVGFVLFFVSPGYIGLLFTSPMGWFLVGSAVLLMIVGVIWLRRVSMIEV